MNPIPKTYIFLLLCLMGLVSCVEHSQINADDSSAEVLDTLTSPAPPLLSFHDVIPEELSDSTKTEIITRLVTEINDDSTLTLVEVPDSLNGPFSCYYRNDSLVMLHLGSGLGYSTKDRPLILSESAKRYYFHSDNLIFSEYHCSSWQQTGRCSPASISVWTWFYEREVISQEMDENIGPYGGCGCGFGYDSFGYDKRLEEFLGIIKKAQQASKASEKL